MASSDVGMGASAVGITSVGTSNIGRSTTRDEPYRQGSPSSYRTTVSYSPSRYTGSTTPQSSYVGTGKPTQTSTSKVSRA
jgi:hypothetical protein